MAQMSFLINVSIQEMPDHSWYYEVRLGSKRLRCGERRTRAGVKRAAIAQLKQLQRDIDEALLHL